MGGGGYHILPNILVTNVVDSSFGSVYGSRLSVRDLKSET